jgi:DNA repair protein RadC
MALKDLPADQRPREKLLARGTAALSNEELLALLLRTGLRGEGVMVLSQQVLAAFDGLPGLLNATPEQLRKVKGLGPAKRAELAAVMELARRALAGQLSVAPVFDHPRALKEYLSLHLAGRKSEAFVALFLDVRYRLLRLDEMFQGTLAHTPVYPREVVRRALDLNAAAVVFAHNHPSGTAEPSLADEQITRQLKAALALVDVRVLDHIIVGNGQVCSLAERGLLP